MAKSFPCRSMPVVFSHSFAASPCNSTKEASSFRNLRLPQQRGFGTLVSRLHLGGATAAKATPNPKEIICRLEAISAALGEIRYTTEQAQMGGAA